MPEDKYSSTEDQRKDHLPLRERDFDCLRIVRMTI